MNYCFEVKMKVRDYECDLQGIVNNAVYQNYTEHTRNEFIRAHQLSLDTLHARGIDAVVAKVVMGFKRPLKPGDEFVCKLAVRKEGVKYIFHQIIERLSDQAICLQADTTVVCVVNGKLGDCAELSALVEKVNA